MTDTASAGEHDLPSSAFARSFGSEAPRYDRTRPSYPAAALEKVLNSLTAPGRAGGSIPRRFLDVGAGTGKLTALLLDRDAEVVAVDPDPDMLAVLSRRLPRVRALAGRAEDIPLPDGSVDVVVAGQAYHWFTRPDADREIARVLRPGGVVGLLWNIPDRSVEWVAELYRATRKPRLPGLRDFDPLDTELFGPLEQAAVPSEHQLAGSDGLHDLVHTWSWVITQSRDEQDAIDQRLRILIGRHAELQGPVVRFLQRTEVFWQHRR
jgi:SAM-dependent methyltransferase